MNVHKRFIFLIGVTILFVFVLTGCNHDEKLAGNIYTSLEKSAQMEKDFGDKQQDLQEADQNEQAIYDKIMALDIDQSDQIKQHIKNAQKCNVKQQQLLEEIKLSFDKSYEVALTIKSNVEEIKDSKQKNRATKVVQLMETRYDLFQSYYNQYEVAIKQDIHLYEQLQDEEMKTTDLDQQINEINQSYSDLKQEEQQFNDYTKRYNKKKAQYYQNASLDEKQIKQKASS